MDKKCDFCGEHLRQLFLTVALAKLLPSVARRPAPQWQRKKTPTVAAPSPNERRNSRAFDSGAEFGSRNEARRTAPLTVGLRQSALDFGPDSRARNEDLGNHVSARRTLTLGMGKQSNALASAPESRGTRRPSVSEGTDTLA